jgi:diaminohydroxyphosphoribosylaminopyrimidine deaminase/5-amino-6-(5-phosphoribosylamino)uracil reductase
MMNAPSSDHIKPDAVAHARYMARALSLARRGQGFVEPNPMVGAVIVRDGVIIGEGYHQRYGKAHAEVNALADARGRGHEVAGATMYVTLEPCAHEGKTPPCAKAIIEAKIGRVCCAMIDPFEQVAGRGVAMLRQAGVEVEVGVLEQEARALNRPFLKRLATGRPWVVLKWAQSLDGKIAAAGGDSRWISSAASRRLVHQWRGRMDAVLVGIGTALADDPQLTARDVRPRREALRVVVDPQLRLPVTSQLLRPCDDRSGDIHPLLIAASAATLSDQQAKADQFRQRGVKFFPLETLGHSTMGQGRAEMDLAPLMAHLAQEHQATNVLVEGGGVLHGSLLRQALADELRVFACPRIVGDERARSGIAGMNCQTMEEARAVTFLSSRKSGEDVLLAYLVPNGIHIPSFPRRRESSEIRRSPANFTGFPPSRE